VVTLIDVDSSNLQAVGYDLAEHSLYVRFHSGRLYRYSRVPPLIYEELMKSESKGKFFDTQVRNVLAFEIVTVAVETSA